MKFGYMLQGLGRGGSSVSGSAGCSQFLVCRSGRCAPVLVAVSSLCPGPADLPLCWLRSVPCVPVSGSAVCGQFLVCRSRRFAPVLVAVSSLCAGPADLPLCGRRPSSARLSSLAIGAVCRRDTNLSRRKFASLLRRGCVWVTGPATVSEQSVRDCSHSRR